MSLVYSLGLALQRLTSVPAPSLPALPVNAALPVITGSAVEGQALSASPGIWSNSPDGYAYQWLRDGGAIGGATAASHVAVAADVGRSLTITVTATNAAGSTAATSAATAVVSAAVPGGTAPERVTAATIGITAKDYETVTYAFSDATFSGPDLTVSRVLTLDGVDVTGDMAGDTYVAPRIEGAQQTLVMTCTASNGTLPDATSTATATVPEKAYVVAFLGQSNLAFGLLDAGTYMGGYPRPTIANVNARFLDGTSKNYLITQERNAALEVNAALVNLSVFLDYVAPGKQFIFVSLAESGTNRDELMDDSDPGRNWSATANRVARVEADHAPTDLLLEWWYTGFSSVLPQMARNLMPFYIKQRDNGEPFVLGAVNPDRGGTVTVDHSLWDIETPLFEKGEGIFSRGWTKYSYVRNHHKDSTAEAHTGIDAFHSDPRIQVFAAPQGVWGGHYANDSSHAITNSADGPVYLSWSWAVPIARLAGVTIHEPDYVGIETASDGSYADVLVSLPNGGELSTTRIVENADVPGSRSDFLLDATAPSYQQEVTGMEIERPSLGLGRTPVHRLDQTVFQKDGNYPGAAFNTGLRGTVTLQSGSETHPTFGRVGRIRVAPEVPFVNGDRIIPMHLRNANTYPQTFDPTGTKDGSNGLPATSKLWLDFPLERVDALRDPAAIWKYPGVPVKPFGPTLTVSGVSAGTPFVFAPRSAVITAASHKSQTMSETVVAGTEGMISLWFRNLEGSWGSGRNLMQLRTPGGTENLYIRTASGGRFSCVAPGLAFSTVASGTFTVGNWGHILMSWKAGAGGWSQVSYNGTAPLQWGATPDAAATSIMVGGFRIFSLGATSTASSAFNGELAHVYFNTQQALDLRDPASIARFISPDGDPVSLGESGQLPTGDVPTFYFDGDAPTWSNRGAGPSVATKGTPLVAGTAPALP